MDFALFASYCNAVYRELWQRKFLALFVFAIVSFAVLLVGMAWPSKFETTATIFADNQNILKPLLQNQAAQKHVQDTTKVVRDMIHSPRILKTVVEKVYGSQFESAEELGQTINQLRNKVKVKGLGSSYIKITYSDSTADEAYRVINTVVDVFIRESAEEQRSESREAFLFIDNQVKQYKDQLVMAEQKLKDFRTLNFDGRDGDVDGSIARLRDQIETLKISIDEDKTTIKNLTKQLADEDEFAASKYKADIYTERLEQLQARLNTLLLTYTEDYPDVVSLKYQIDDVKETIREAQLKTQGEQPKLSEEDKVLNPLYQELRSRLSQVVTDQKAKEKRLQALNDLLIQEYDRRKRIAERAAEEAELTRDYNVTKKIYEDMLERKEKARLSMTLNVEGQGITYRIQEPALPPLNPTGLRFLHFVLIGPFVGFFFVVGIAVLYVIVDPRIRFPDSLDQFNVQVLAVVPHLQTPFSQRVVRMDMILCIFLGLLIMGLYLGLAYASKVGLI